MSKWATRWVCFAPTSYDFWVEIIGEFTKWIIWMLISIMNMFFFRDPIFPGKPTSLSNKPNIQKRPIHGWILSYMFFEICIVLVSGTFLTAQLQFSTAFHSIPSSASGLPVMVPFLHHPMTPLIPASNAEDRGFTLAISIKVGKLKNHGLTSCRWRQPPQFTRFRYGRKLWATYKVLGWNTVTPSEKHFLGL